MELLIQPDKSNLCGQYTLSMITGISVDDICEELKNDDQTSLRKELMPFLKKRKYKVSHSWAYSFDEVPNDSIVLFYRRDDTGHFVLKKDGKYYDPLLGVVLEYDPRANRVWGFVKFEKK